MGPHTTSTNGQGPLLRQKREQLKLSIEEMARRAGVGSETWRRYESGQAIRDDKLRGVCQALGVVNLSSLTVGDPFGHESQVEEVPEYGSQAFRDDLRCHRACQTFQPNLPDIFGDSDEADKENFFLEVSPSVSYFAEGLLKGLDWISQFDIDPCLDELKRMPKGSHLGQVHPETWLPERWITFYDHEFLWKLNERLTEINNELEQSWISKLETLRLSQCVADGLLLDKAIMAGSRIMRDGNDFPYPNELYPACVSLLGDMMNEVGLAHNGMGGGPSTWFDLDSGEKLKPSLELADSDTSTSDSDN